MGPTPSVPSFLFTSLRYSTSSTTTNHHIQYWPSSRQPNFLRLVLVLAKPHRIRCRSAVSFRRNWIQVPVAICSSWWRTQSIPVMRSLIHTEWLRTMLCASSGLAAFPGCQVLKICTTSFCNAPNMSRSGTVFSALRAVRRPHVSCRLVASGR